MNTFVIALRKKEMFVFGLIPTFQPASKLSLGGVARSLAIAALSRVISRVLSRLVSVAINGELVRRLLLF